MNWQRRACCSATWQQLLTEHRELLEPYFLKQAVRPDADRFAAWHAAFWTSGTLLYVPRGVDVELPLHSLIAHSSDGVAEFGHTLIIVEDEARATLLEETTSANEDLSGLHVGCVELIVGRNANLRYVQLQNWNQKSWHFAHQAGIVESAGSLQWTVVGLGSRLSHIHQDVNLQGRAATAEVNGATFASMVKRSLTTHSSIIRLRGRTATCSTKKSCVITLESSGAG